MPLFPTPLLQTYKQLFLKSFLFISLLFFLDKIPFLTTLHLETKLPCLAENYSSLRPLFLGQIKTDLLFVGSSRTLLHFDPRVIQKDLSLSAYILARQGANIIEQHFLLQEFLHHNPPPQVIIFEVDPIFLTSNYLDFNPTPFKAYSLFSLHTAKQLTHNSTLTSVLFSGIPHTLTRLQEINSRPTKYQPFTLTNGAQLMHHQTQIDPRTPETFLPSRQNQQLLENLTHSLALQKTKLIFLQSPYYQTGSSKRFSPQTQKAVNHFFQTLASENNHTYYLDYSQDPFFFMRPDLFYDNDHLNLKGAYFLSIKISQDIQSLQILP